MDPRHDYAVLAKFSTQQAPFSPFEPGMQGEIHGVLFTIIGMVGWEAQGDVWVDLQLYSETHGYAWLSYERGHVCFVRKTRHLPNALVWNLAPKQSVTDGLRTYRLYERYMATINYVAGELTWVAAVGNRVQIVEAIAPPLLLSGERSSTETEYHLSEYLDPAAVYRAFQVSGQIWPRAGVHAAQPYHGPFKDALSKAAFPFAILSGVLAAALWLFGSGVQIHQETFLPGDLQTGRHSAEIEITRPNRLVALEMETNLDNAWVDFDIDVLKDNEEIFSMGKAFSFYEGRDDEGYWSEGSRSARALFKVPEPGRYRLNIQLADGGTGETGTTPPETTLELSVRQGYISSYYFVILLIITGIATLIGPGARIAFERRRWKAVLDDDDDD